MKLLNKKLNEKITSFDSYGGFDLNIKMSINYLNRYLKGRREIKFFNSKDELLINYIKSSNLWENHHCEKNNEIVLVSLYPLPTLFIKYLREINTIYDDKKLINKETRKVNKYIEKYKKQNEKLINHINKLTYHTNNRLAIRIPHLSSSAGFYDKYKSSFIISKEEFINLSIFNNDIHLDKLINGTRFSYILKGDISRLFIDFERLIGNNSGEENNGFSFIPYYAISNKSDENKVQIRNFKYVYDDPNYLIYLKRYIDFNYIFEKKVKDLLPKTKKYLFILSLHSFSETYVIKKNPRFSKRKFPDINIIFSKNTPKYLLSKIKNKAYYLDHKYKIKASFNFPYNGTYELLFNCNRTICFTIEINKKIYLEGDNFDTLKDNILPLKKYLDEFFLFLLHL